jgi:hypothetical protein
VGTKKDPSFIYQKKHIWEQQCVETFNKHHGTGEDLTKDIPITRTEQCQQRP